MVQSIPLDRIALSTNNPRKEMSDCCLDDNKQYQTIEGLAENIKEIGLINPITVKQHQPGWYSIIAGERRYRACKSIGMVDIPCIVVEVNNEQEMIIQLSENLQRKDLSEVEKAEGVKETIVGTGFSPLDLGSKLGVSKRYINYLLQLANFPEPIKESVKADEISAKSIRPLSQLDSDAEKIAVAEIVKKRGMNYDDTKEFVDAVKSLPPETRLTVIEEAKQAEQVNGVWELPSEQNGESDVNYSLLIKRIEDMETLLSPDKIKSYAAIDKILLKRKLMQLQMMVGMLLSKLDTL